jgi:hypothetical protein
MNMAPLGSTGIIMPSRYLATIASIIFLSTPASAWSDMDSMKPSVTLGDVLASMLGARLNERVPSA